MIIKKKDIYELTIFTWKAGKMKTFIREVNEDTMWGLVRTIQTLEKYYQIEVDSIVEFYYQIEKYGFYSTESISKDFEIEINISKFERSYYQ